MYIKKELRWCSKLSLFFLTGGRKMMKTVDGVIVGLQGGFHHSLKIVFLRLLSAFCSKVHKRKTVFSGRTKSQVLSR